MYRFSTFLLLITPLASYKILVNAFSFQNQQIFDVKGSVETRETTFRWVDKPLLRESWLSFSNRRKTTATYTFEYSFDELILEVGDTDLSPKSIPPTTIVMLIHPIGIGIGKWYYHRLFEALEQERDRLKTTQEYHRYIFLAPDLLASGSACHPWIMTPDNTKEEPNVLPLLSIDDWSCQLLSLMANYESQIIAADTNPATLVDYCIVANGGFASIALDMAYQLVKSNITSSTINKLPKGKPRMVVLSAPPRVSGLLYRESPNVDKLQRTYNRLLLGLPGRFFWWYALRNKGQFLQKFTEKNLVAQAENLSPDWRSKCFETAKSFGQRSKYSAFAFLAGALQRNCMPYLEALNGKGVAVNIIAPEDARPNDAKSWLWQKRRFVGSPNSLTKKERVGADVSRFLREQDLGGNEIQVRGRRCLAHEDARGYAKALLHFLE